MWGFFIVVGGKRIWGRLGLMMRGIDEDTSAGSNLELSDLFCGILISRLSSIPFLVCPHSSGQHVWSSHREVNPPSTTIFPPVIKLALELHRNAMTFATSPGSPILCIGTRGM